MRKQGKFIGGTSVCAVGMKALKTLLIFASTVRLLYSPGCEMKKVARGNITIKSSMVNSFKYAGNLLKMPNLAFNPDGFAAG